MTKCIGCQSQLRRAPNHCLEVHHFAPEIPISIRDDTPETAYETDLLVDGIVLGKAVATQRTN